MMTLLVLTCAWPTSLTNQRADAAGRYRFILTRLPALTRSRILDSKIQLKLQSFNCSCYVQQEPQIDDGIQLKCVHVLDLNYTCTHNNHMKNIIGMQCLQIFGA